MPGTVAWSPMRSACLAPLPGARLDHENWACKEAHACTANGPPRICPLSAGLSDSVRLRRSVSHPHPTAGRPGACSVTRQAASGSKFKHSARLPWNRLARFAEGLLLVGEKSTFPEAMHVEKPCLEGNRRPVVGMVG
eukprot:363500-Chlamydomonas_euryale.AAC.4